MTVGGEFVDVDETAIAVLLADEVEENDSGNVSLASKFWYVQTYCFFVGVASF